MKTLKLKHVQHYPIGKNGIRYVNTENTEYTFHVFELKELYVTLWDDDSGLERVYFNRDSHLKPTFRPLSSLTKPIKVEGYNDGKEFVPIVELAKIGNKWIIEDGLEDRIYFSQWDTGVCEVFVRTASPEDPRIFVFEIYDYLTQPYRIIQKLFQWHFAVDIPDGTWIDINTL